jgi:hypothetical protein
MLLLNSVAYNVLELNTYREQCEEGFVKFLHSFIFESTICKTVTFFVIKFYL